MITVLSGGTGSVKLVRGLARTSKEDIAIIVNVGDNVWMHGLYVCPDVDTILYGLAGILDEERGWGIKGDSFHFLEQMKLLGEDVWFKLGDKDLATHILRTRLIKEGLSLSEATDIIRIKLGVRQKVLPATNEPVETYVITEVGKLHFQEFWVKRGGRDRVLGVEYKGAEYAKPAPEVLDSIARARRIIICPANPITSIGPILAIPSVKEELTRAKEVVAVSPIIGSEAISGPAGRLMKGLGIDVSSVGVANLYSEFLDVMVIDEEDVKLKERIEELGIKVFTTRILMRGREDEERLARLLIW